MVPFSRGRPSTAASAVATRTCGAERSTSTHRSPSSSLPRCDHAEPIAAPWKYVGWCYHDRMRTTVVFDDDLAAEARALGINVSEAARQGLRQAIRQRRAERDRTAYLARPEVEDADWDDAEAWGEP